jgi:hypothetical protein
VAADLLMQTRMRAIAAFALRFQLLMSSLAELPADPASAESRQKQITLALPQSHIKTFLHGSP